MKIHIGATRHECKNITYIKLLHLLTAHVEYASERPIQRDVSLKLLNIKNMLFNVEFFFASVTNAPKYLKISGNNINT